MTRDTGLPGNVHLRKPGGKVYCGETCFGFGARATDKLEEANCSLCRSFHDLESRKPTLVDSLVATSNKIFEATKRNPANWVKVYMPEDPAEREMKLAYLVAIFGEPEFDSEMNCWVWRTPKQPDATCSHCGGLLSAHNRNCQDPLD